MLIGRYNEHGQLAFEHKPNLPSDFTCPEWKAYDEAFDRAKEAGETWNEELAATYSTYQARMQARYDAGDYEDITGDEEEEEVICEEPINAPRQGFLSRLFGW